MKPLLHPSAARRAGFTGEVAKLSIRAMGKADFSASIYVDKNGRRAGVQALHLKPPYIGCATAMQRICLMPAPICGTFKSCWGTRAHARQRFTPMCVGALWNKCVVHLMIFRVFCVYLTSKININGVVLTQQTVLGWMLIYGS